MAIVVACVFGTFAVVAWLYAIYFDAIQRWLPQWYRKPGSTALKASRVLSFVAAIGMTILFAAALMRV